MPDRHRARFHFINARKTTSASLVENFSSIARMKRRRRIFSRLVNAKPPPKSFLGDVHLNQLPAFRNNKHTAACSGARVVTFPANAITKSTSRRTCNGDTIYCARRHLFIIFGPPPARHDRNFANKSAQTKKSSPCLSLRLRVQPATRPPELLTGPELVLASQMSTATPARRPAV